eukprot:9489654-Pyramimonas_sp.AAC.1
MIGLPPTPNDLGTGIPEVAVFYVGGARIVFAFSYAGLGLTRDAAQWAASWSSSSAPCPLLILNASPSLVGVDAALNELLLIVLRVPTSGLREHRQ